MPKKPAKKFNFADPLSVFSNILFLIPIGIAWYFDNFLAVLIIAGVMINSFAYHWVRPHGYYYYWDKPLNSLQKNLLYADVTFAIGLGTYDLYLLLQRGFDYHFWISLALGLLALYIFSKPTKQHYDINHALWHALSVAITILALLA